MPSELVTKWGAEVTAGENPAGGAGTSSNPARNGQISSLDPNSSNSGATPYIPGSV